jgi:DNA-binding CsgD family transcriptional regulator
VVGFERRLGHAVAAQVVGHQAELVGQRALVLPDPAQVVLGPAIDLTVPDGRRATEVPSVQKALGLTAREAEVLDLVARGYTNREIAATLVISTKTASIHVSHILHKLGVPNRLEAAAIAHRLAGPAAQR